MDERTRLMQWQPGAEGYTPDDIIVAVGLQCAARQFTLANVLTWLAQPAKCGGDSRAGQIAYYFHSPGPTFAMFDVKDGLVVGFGTVERFRPNSYRNGPDGKRICFNVLDEMEPFDAASFK